MFIFYKYFFNKNSIAYEEGQLLGIGFPRIASIKIIAK
jgi:hypothetical protein